MLSLVARLRGGDFLRGVALIAAGSAVAQFLPTLLTPILTRIYTPQDFGVLGLFTAFIGVAAPLVSFQYSKAIVSAKDEDEALHLGVLTFWLIIPSSVLFTLLLWFLVAAGRMGYQNFPSYALPLMFVALNSSAVYTLFRYWSIRNANFKTVSIGMMFQSGARILVQVAMGFIGVGPFGLVSGEVLGRSIGIGSLAARSKNLVNGIVKPPVWKELKIVATRYWRFPLLSTPSMLLSSVALSLPVPLITSGFGVEEAGQFSVATRILLIPMVILGRSVGDVFHSRIADYARTRPELAKTLVVRVAAGLLLAGIVPMGVVLVAGPNLWRLVLGDEWVLSGQIAQAIVPWVLIQLVVTPISQVIPVYQRQDLKLFYDVLALVSVISVLSLGPSLGLSLIETSRVLGLSQAIVYSVFFFLLLRAVSGKPVTEP